MNVYLLERTDYWSYDMYDSAVVVAKDEEEAKNLFPKHFSKTYDPLVKDIIVTIIATEAVKTDADIICASYNAG